MHTYVDQIMDEFPLSTFKKHLERTSVKSWQEDSYKLAINYAYGNLSKDDNLTMAYLRTGRRVVR